ncbi:MAG: hypothetical protein ACXWCH_33935 [Burkholderiales bacterium]
MNDGLNLQPLGSTGNTKSSGRDSERGVFATMGDSTKLRSKELARITRASRDEFAREQQADLLAFVDRNREIVELPPGLENGQTRKRLRGARTDSDCIDEICEIVAQGITATAIFIDKCEHVSLLASKLSPCKANKLFRSKFGTVTHLGDEVGNLAAIILQHE